MSENSKKKLDSVHDSTPAPTGTSPTHELEAIQYLISQLFGCMLKCLLPKHGRGFGRRIHKVGMVCQQLIMLCKTLISHQRFWNDSLQYQTNIPLDITGNNRHWSGIWGDTLISLETVANVSIQATPTAQNLMMVVLVQLG